MAVAFTRGTLSEADVLAGVEVGLHYVKAVLAETDVLTTRDYVAGPKASQAVISVLSSATGQTRTSQSAVMVLGAKPADFMFASQAPVLALTQTGAKKVFNSQSVQLALGAAEPPMMNVSQAAVLVLARAQPDRRRIRAWPLAVDGHKFYVLRLGNTGTLVFDTTTRKWSEWSSPNYNVWRINCGLNWRNFIIGGSLDTNMLFNIDPTLPTDDDVPFVTILSGSFQVRLRNTVTCDEVQVTASKGAYTTPDGSMEMFISDDFGSVFRSVGKLPMGAVKPDYQISWRSLGEINAPGRIFQLVEFGAAQRVNSMEMFSRDIQDG